MTQADDGFLLQLLQACADLAPEPLYPARYSQEKNLDRGRLDDGLDALRRRGLLNLTEWTHGLGQGCALTELGTEALQRKRVDLTAPSPQTTKRNGAYSIFDRGETVRDALYYPGRPYDCWVLLIANVLYFLVGAGYAAMNDLPVVEYLNGEDGLHRTTVRVVYALGGLYDAAVFPDPAWGVRPQIERLLLFNFLHIGIWHLALNMFFLATLASLIESMWGSVRFLSIYLISGFVSGCVVIGLDILMDRHAMVAGASGCLYGAFASMLVWFGLNYQHVPEQAMRDWARTLSINVIVLISTSLLPQTSWQGHLGGAIGGALCALLFHVQRFHPKRAMRILALAAVPAIPVSFFVAACWLAYRL